MCLDRVPQRLISENTILVLSANTLSFYEALIFKFLNNSQDCTFGNSDILCDLAERGFGVLAKSDQHVRVVREERPSRWALGLG
jgi:hypothetical protein